jgi:hypothetical protein
MWTAINACLAKKWKGSAGVKRGGLKLTRSGDEDG